MLSCKKIQDNKLKNCCIWLVIYLNSNFIFFFVFLCSDFCCVTRCSNANKSLCFSCCMTGQKFCLLLPPRPLPIYKLLSAPNFSLKNWVPSRHGKVYNARIRTTVLFTRHAVTSLTVRLLMSYIYIYIYMEHLFLMFLDHTQRRSTVGRTPLDE